MKIPSTFLQIPLLAMHVFFSHIFRLIAVYYFECQMLLGPLVTDD